MQALEMLDFAVKNNQFAVLGSSSLKKDSIRLHNLNIKKNNI